MISAFSLPELFGVPCLQHGLGCIASLVLASLCPTGHLSWLWHTIASPGSAGRDSGEGSTSMRAVVGVLSLGSASASLKSAFHQQILILVGLGRLWKRVWMRNLTGLQGGRKHWWAEEQNESCDIELCEIDVTFLTIASLICLLSMSCNLSCLSNWKVKRHYLKHQCNIKCKKSTKTIICSVTYLYTLNFASHRCVSRQYYMFPPQILPAQMWHSSLEHRIVVISLKTIV